MWYVSPNCSGAVSVDHTGQYIEGVCHVPESAHSEALGDLMSALELRIPPVVLVLLTAVVMAALAPAFPSYSFPFPAGAPFAAALAVAGGVIALLGVWEFRRAGTTVDPRVPEQSASLVVRGVYRFSRNPMYLGFLLVLCAWGVFLGNVLALAMLPVFVAYMNRFQIGPEERHMREKFPQPYAAYVARVRRWI